MIVLEKQKLAIITPPHTASGNLHRALCSPDFGGFWIVGHSPLGYMDHHITNVPPAWAHYQIACVIRDPIDRLRGLYVHHTISAERIQTAPLTWPRYVAAVATDSAGQLPNALDRFTITRLLHKQPIAETIRFEHLAEDLAKFIGRPVPLAPGWTDDGQHPPIAELFPDDESPMRFLAAAWSLPDRARFGYALPW